MRKAGEKRLATPKQFQTRSVYQCADGEAEQEEGDWGSKRRLLSG